MKSIAAVIVMFGALTAYGQTKPVEAQKKVDAAAESKLDAAAKVTEDAASKPREVTPKESIDSVKLDLVLEKQQKIQVQAQLIQGSIEPQMAPLRQQYNDVEKAVQAQIEIVKKANGWGDDVSLDRNPQSPTVGKFIKTPKPPATPEVKK